MTARLWIVRHGNTFDKGDTVTRVGGRTDLPLSTSGRAQAEALSDHFANAVERFETAIVSPLKRTWETADTILAGQTQSPRLETVEFLREIDYGPDENKPEPDVVARIGEGALRLWEAQAVIPSGWQVDAEAIRTGWRALFERVRRTPGDHLAVTSNGIARFALIELRAQEDNTLKLPTGGYGRIDFSNGGFTVTSWGDPP